MRAIIHVLGLVTAGIRTSIIDQTQKTLSGYEYFIANDMAIQVAVSAAATNR